MSSAYLRLSMNREPQPLIGCNTLQHTIVELEINDPDGKLIARAAMSTDQFLRLMIGNMNVDCTLIKYPKNRSDFIEEVPPMPQTHREDVKERLAEMQANDNERIEGIVENLHAMINGHQKANKTTLAELLKQIEMIKNYRSSNAQFVVQQAEEAVGAIENDLRSGLSLMASQIMGEDAGTKITKALMPGGDVDQKRLEEDMNLTNISTEVSQTSSFPKQEIVKKQETLLVPMPDGPPPLQLPVIDIDQMTAADMAREINRRLMAFENDKKVNEVSEKHGTKRLYGSGATTGGRGNKQVRIWYVAYQGACNIDEDTARAYLKELRTGNFVTHYRFLRK